MSLDLGALVAHATIETAAFDRSATRLFRVLSTFGTQADKASSGVRVLDDSLVAAGGSATKASASINRASAAAQKNAAAAEKAAAAQKTNAAATSQVNKVMAQYAGESARVQAAALRVAAAQDRLEVIQRAGVATTRQLASAQATLIGAQRSLAAAQEAGAVSGGRFRTSMAGTLKMAAGLGVIVGAFAAVKKAIDIGKQAGAFQREMLLIQTQARGTAAEVTDLSARVLNMAGDVATAPDQLATSLYHVYSVGRDANGVLIRGARAMDIVKIAAEGATVGMGGVEETTNALTSTVASGIAGVKNFSQAMGVLNTIVGVGDMHFSDLNAGLGTGILARMRVFGVSIQETGAALATFGDNNIRGADAATALRMSVQDLAKPSAAADAVLAKIGLTADELRQTLSEKGLAGALHLLDDRMTRAGITGSKVGGFLEDAFTKKAGAGLAIMLTQMDRFDAKLGEINKGGDSFASQWKATTQTASFQFRRLGTEAEVAGIKLANKLLPAATTAATWLGTNLPHAISTLGHILGPTVHLVGAGLGGAWHLVAGVLKVAVGALGAVGHFLSQHKALVTAVTIALLGMWAAVKTIAIAKAIFTGISAALGTLRLQAALAGMEMESMSASTAAAKAATVALGVGIAAVTYLWMKHQQQAADTRASVEAYTQAIEDDSNALGKNTRALVEHNLNSTDAYNVALKLGISQGVLTDAILGNKAALAEVTAAEKAYNDGSSEHSKNLIFLSSVLGTNTSDLKAGAVAARNKAAADREAAQAAAQHKSAVDASRAAAKRGADAVSRLAVSTRHEAGASHAATMGMDGQSVSAKRLADYIQRLTTKYQTLINTELSQDQAQLAFKQGLLGLKQQVKEYGKSLSDATVKGAENRQNMLSLLQMNEQAAEGSKNYGAALLANVKSFRAHATAAGYSKTAVDNLLRSEKLLPRQIEQRLHLSGGAATMSQLRSIQTQINKMHGKTLFVGVAGGHTLPGSAGGRAQVPEGVSAVGERGTELLVKDGPKLGVVPHGPAMSFLRATGARIQGFAGGTKPNPITTGTSDGKKVWIYAGIRYASLAAAQNAETRATTQTPAEKRKAAHDHLKGGRGTVAGFRHIGRLLGDLTSTRSDFASVFGSIYSALRDAGASRQFVRGLKKEDDAILAAVGKRDKAAKRLAIANQALANARKVLRTDRHAFAGAVVGSFDITSAGADANGRVTRGGIVAADNQAVTRARAFVAGMKKLIGLKVFPNRYLRSLLGQGPAALAQVQALAGMPRAELVQLANDNRQLSKLGNQIGTLGAGRLDQGRVDAAQKQVNHWQKIEDRREQRLENALDRFANRIENKLGDLHMVGKLGLTKGELALIVDTGRSQNAHRTRSAPPRPGGRP